MRFQLWHPQISIVYQTIGPWKNFRNFWKRFSYGTTAACTVGLLTSWLPLSCSSWPHSARDSFTDWKNWFDSRQHHASMRISYYSERNSPSLSGHLNALKCCSKMVNFENFSSSFFSNFFLLFFSVKHINVEFL